MQWVLELAWKLSGSVAIQRPYRGYDISLRVFSWSFGSVWNPILKD
jgi:hypothetical protein